MIDLSASKLELARRCLGAFTVAQSRESNPYSDAGKERHAADEAAIKRGDTPTALTETWPGFDWRAEVAFAFDVATGVGREIGQGKHRDYSSASAFEVCGTADAVGIKMDSTGRIIALVIADKKSFEEVAAACDNPQLRFLALAASRAYGLESAEVGITSELRAPDRATLEAWDLEETALQVREIALAVHQAKLDASEGRLVQFATGRQCRWCDGFASCPKQKELMALINAPQFQIENQIALQDDKDAAEAYELWKRLGILHKRIGQTLYGRAQYAPIPLPNGKVFGQIEKLGNEQLDGDVVYEIVKAKHGQAVADAAVSREASKTKLREALGFVAAKGQVAAAEREVLEEVRARGGAKRKRELKVEEFDPQKQLRAVND